jgi:hypothetical protein
MPESVVREELKALDNRIQGVTQLRSGAAIRNLPRAIPTH